MAVLYDDTVRLANGIFVLTRPDGQAIRTRMPNRGETAQKLAALRKEAGLSGQQLADALGMQKSSYTHYESKRFKDFLPVELTIKLAEVFKNKGITEERVLALAGLSQKLISTTVKGSQRSVDTTPPGNVRVRKDAAVEFEEQEDLPVYGHVAGVGEDEVFFIDQGHEVTRTVRPAILRAVREAYAVDVYGDSMSPRFEPGNRLWVNPRRPTKRGDDVVIELDDERAMVKRLVRKTDKHVVVQQFNPPKEIKIPRDKVKHIHLVVGMLTVTT